MTTTAITKETGITPEALESILVEGNLDKLSPAQRLDYYSATCKSLGLNPLTKPFAYIKLNGKTTLYALKETTDQLRKLNGISVRITSREMIEASYVVTAFATDRDGRTDESTGAVPMTGLQGEAHSNALMKAETKAKRRVTLSIAGLGMLDETEADSIPGAQVNHVDIDTGEFIDAPRQPRATKNEVAQAVSEVAKKIEAEVTPEAVVVLEPVVEAEPDEAKADSIPFCDDHGVSYVLKQNPATGEARYVHEYRYVRDGEEEERTGWCVSKVKVS